MGCDGGTIPKRHELVKGPKRVEKIDKNAELVARWYYCTLSQEKLTKPIVACELGRLYNKDAVIEFLLDKSPDKPHAESAAHIKSMKSVIELNLSDNPAWSGDKGNRKGDAYDEPCAQFICPVVGLEMNGRHRFCVLRGCGCVFSERALKEIKTDICHKCVAPLDRETEQNRFSISMPDQLKRFLSNSEGSIMATQLMERIGKLSQAHNLSLQSKVNSEPISNYISEQLVVLNIAKYRYSNGRGGGSVVTCGELHVRYRSQTSGRKITTLIYSLDRGIRFKPST
ncbi:RTF2 homolog [Pelobates cultripes]|uniref:Replication termination factor 2 n=1 Tax=Pelobates cultripes TaxID=61616 RepID=A0AAD1SMH4_PELCU|nr:RTF2 homolog [Pelobates cultripes]